MRAPELLAGLLARWMCGGFGLLAATGVLLGACGSASGQDAPGGRALQEWVYCLAQSIERESERPSVEAAAGKVDVLAVTGYKLSQDGHVHGLSQQIRNHLVAVGARSRATMLPVVAFRSSSEGRRLLVSPSARETARGELAALARDGAYAGLHLDFEYLPPEDAPRLEVFLRELREALKGAKLTMAVFPPVDFPAKWSGFHDLVRIGPLLDEIVLMCYDYHRPGTPAGPVVDLEWTRRNVLEVLKSVRPGKLWLGMPAYGYSWSADGKTRVVSAREAARLAGRSMGVRHASGTLHVRIPGPNGGHEAYVADRETRRRMEALADSFGLRGVALWRLGFEED